MNDDKSKPHLVNREKQHAVVVREKVPMNQLPQFFGRVFGKTMGVAQAQGRQIIGPPFAVYFGMPTDTVDVAAGFPIDEYSRSTLMEIVRWVRSDDVIRSADDEVAVIMRELGFQRRGPWILRSIGDAQARLDGIS